MDTTTKEKVKFGKAIKNTDNDISYVSKCGRFTILRKEYCLPVVSVGYVLVDSVDGSENDCDSLAEAKDFANELVKEVG